MSKYSLEEIQQRLVFFAPWTYENGYLKRRFTFKNFAEATGFVIRVALAAEKLNHHPTLHWTYNCVDVLLSTHEVQGITERDFLLAEAIEL
ncbi:MAG: 4a-hydroxytetrahydrobiopterin dehydratase [Bacteroidia bacterium]